MTTLYVSACVFVGCAHMCKLRCHCQTLQRPFVCKRASRRVASWCLAPRTFSYLDSSCRCHSQLQGTTHRSHTCTWVLVGGLQAHASFDKIPRTSRFYIRHTPSIYTGRTSLGVRADSASTPLVSVVSTLHRSTSATISHRIPNVAAGGADVVSTSLSKACRRVLPRRS